MLILLGEGFFKLVVTLSDKGIYKVGAGTLVNMTLGGLSVFALAWVYFDSVGNAKPKNRDLSVLLPYWFCHIAVFWGAVTIGVALAGEIYVGFWEPYPADYAFVGCLGLIVFLAFIWALQTLVEGRDITRRYAHGWIRLFGIAMMGVQLALLGLLPSILGNLIFAIALFAQVIWPFVLAMRDMRTVQAS